MNNTTQDDVERAAAAVDQAWMDTANALQAPPRWPTDLARAVSGMALLRLLPTSLRHHGFHFRVPLVNTLWQLGRSFISRGRP